MTPDIKALVARLERDSDTDDAFSKAAYALRQQAGEIERLTQENRVIAGHLGLNNLVEQRDALQARVRELSADVETLEKESNANQAECFKVIAENDALRAENESLWKRVREASSDNDALATENDGLRKDAERYRKVAQYVAGDEDGLFCFDVALQIREPFNTAADIKAALDSAIDDEVIEDMTP